MKRDSDRVTRPLRDKVLQVLFCADLPAIFTPLVSTPAKFQVEDGTVGGHHMAVRVELTSPADDLAVIAPATERTIPMSAIFQLKSSALYNQPAGQGGLAFANDPAGILRYAGDMALDFEKSATKTEIKTNEDPSQPVVATDFNEITGTVRMTFRQLDEFALALAFMGEAKAFTQLAVASRTQTFEGVRKGSRLVGMDRHGVTFRWKDYRARSAGKAWQKTMTLTATRSSAASCSTSCPTDSTASATTDCSPPAGTPIPSPASGRSSRRRRRTISPETTSRSPQRNPSRPLNCTRHAHAAAAA